MLRMRRIPLRRDGLNHKCRTCRNSSLPSPQTQHVTLAQSTNRTMQLANVQCDRTLSKTDYVHKSPNRTSTTTAQNKKRMLRAITDFHKSPTLHIGAQLGVRQLHSKTMHFRSGPETSSNVTPTEVDHANTYV